MGGHGRSWGDHEEIMRRSGEIRRRSGGDQGRRTSCFWPLCLSRMVMTPSKALRPTYLMEGHGRPVNGSPWKGDDAMKALRPTYTYSAPPTKATHREIRGAQERSGRDHGEIVLVSKVLGAADKGELIWRGGSELDFALHLRKVVEGRERSWKVVKGRGRSWKVVEGRGRPWKRPWTAVGKAVEGRGRPRAEGRGRSVEGRGRQWKAVPSLLSPARGRPSVWRGRGDPGRSGRSLEIGGRSAEIAPARCRPSD